MSQVVLSVCALLVGAAAVLVALSTWRLQQVSTALMAKGLRGETEPQPVLRETNQPEQPSAVTQLAEAGATQAHAMVRLAELSAEGLRASTGAYVFQLRDRFDEAFPQPQLTVSDATWRAVAEENLGPVEYLVFHDGDCIRFTAILVCNQAPLRRRMKFEIGELPETVTRADVRYVTAMHKDSTLEHFQMAPDVTVFVELSFDVKVSALTLGRFKLEIPTTALISNNRPEGAISTIDTLVVIEGTTLTDEDGVGVDLLSVESQVGTERRLYFLDKGAKLPLVLPIG
jgi:hypothetical protein